MDSGVDVDICFFRDSPSGVPFADFTALDLGVTGADALTLVMHD